MYTKKIKSINKLSLCAIIAFILVLAMFFNIQNAYAESDIYNSFEENIETITSEQQEPINLKTDIIKITLLIYYF